MVRSRGRISGSNLSRVDDPNAHTWISGGIYNPTDNLMLSGKKDGSYLSSLSARWESYIDPNTAGDCYGVTFSPDGMQCFVVAADYFETYSLSEPYGTPTYVSKVSLDSDRLILVVVLQPGTSGLLVLMECIFIQVILRTIIPKHLVFLVHMTLVPVP